MASITFKNVKKVYPNGVVAVQSFDLDIADREFVVLVGPSGCGKSTTLRMIAGLEDITEGELYLGDKLINDVVPKNRDIAMVFQNYALYPHLTVFDNIAFGLKLRKVPRKIIKKKVEDVAQVLNLEELLQRKPKALSGGQRQRVALGRAIVRDPAVFLLDEPLSNLDANLRTQMRSEIKKLHYRLGTTFVYVTHDQTEAMTMGDRLVVMKDGFVQQVDSPQNLYDNPCNLFVAGFIGSPKMNTIEAVLKRRDGGIAAVFDGGALSIPAARTADGSLDNYIDKEVIIGIRPECFYLEKESVSVKNPCMIDARVELSEQIGSGVYLYVMCGTSQLIATLPTHGAARHGENVRLAVDCDKLYIFDKDTEQRLVSVEEAKTLKTIAAPRISIAPAEPVADDVYAKDAVFADGDVHAIVAEAVDDDIYATVAEAVENKIHAEFADDPESDSAAAADDNAVTVASEPSDVAERF